MSAMIKLADAAGTDIGDLVDLAHYPIDRPDDPGLSDLIETVRTELAADGCCVLPGFLTPDGLALARRQSNELAPKAFFRRLLCNLYNSAPDPSLPEGDPRTLFFERTSGFVSRDMIPADTAFHRLYVAPAMKGFVAACMEQPEIYEYADPFAGLVLNVLPPESQQPWHYDTNEFITTIMTQDAEVGGEFQYCPNIRQPGDENLDGVGRLLRGEDSSPIKRLELRPGDLQLFKGRYALHQVSRVEGSRERHTAVFGYATRPGLVGPLERTRQLYGRVAEAHILAERSAQQSTDGLIR